MSSVQRSAFFGEPIGCDMPKMVLMTTRPQMHVCKSSTNLLQKERFITYVGYRNHSWIRSDTCPSWLLLLGTSLLPTTCQFWPTKKTRYADELRKQHFYFNIHSFCLQKLYRNEKIMARSAVYSFACIELSIQLSLHILPLEMQKVDAKGLSE